MGVIFIEGFDYYSPRGVGQTLPVSSRWWVQSDGETIPTGIDIVDGRFDNSKALYMLRNGPGLARTSIVIPLTTTSFTIGFANKQNTLPISGSQLFLSLYISSAGSSANPALDFYKTSTGSITVQYSTTVLFGTSSPCITTEWNYIEIEVDVHPTAGRISIYADSENVLNLTNINTVRVGNGIPDCIRFTCAQNNSYLIDDMYVSDTSEKLGGAKVSVVVPDSDTLPPSLSVQPPASPNHYSVVSALPPVYTSYVYGDVNGLEDRYGLSELASGAPSVFGIQPVVVVRKTDFGNRALKISLIDDGTVVDSTTQQLRESTTGFFRYDNPVTTINPNTLNAWTRNDIDSMQLGLEIGDEPQ